VFLVISLALSFGQANKVHVEKLVVAGPEEGSRLGPKMINFQGYLADSAGNAISDTALLMEFSIFDAPELGNELWTEPQSVNVEEGVFNVHLGQFTPIPDSVFRLGMDRWLQLFIPPDQLLAPRTRIASMAYAYTATYADTAGYAMTGTPDGDWNIVEDDMHSGVSGNVGVGTPVPNEKLHVVSTLSGGGIKVEGSSAPSMYLDNSGIPKRWALSVEDGSGKLIISEEVNQRILVDTSGNVGIGTPVPTEKLDVDGAVQMQGFKMPSGAADGFVLMSDPSGAGFWQPVPAEPDTDWIISGSDMFSGVSGNVGIGIPVPTEKLDVDGAVQMQGFKIPVGAADGYVLTSDASGFGNWQPAVGDDDWVRGTPDSVLFTMNNLGIARGGASNVLYGDSVHTDVNLGVACTTGSSGQDHIYATISGGYGNEVQLSYGTVSGGIQNQALNSYSTVGGGQSNVASGSWAIVSGGNENGATQHYSTVGGGHKNVASAEYSTVCGGDNNAAFHHYSIVGGGEADTCYAAYSGVFSGYRNLAGDASFDTAAFVGGGGCNRATGKFATVCGGDTNLASNWHSTVCGGAYNIASGEFAIVGGGVVNTASGSNSIVGSGSNNTASGEYSTVSGGMFNTCIAKYGGIVSGNFNVAGDMVFVDSFAFVGGGCYNEATADFSTITGGYDNDATGEFSAVGGGAINIASSWSATVAGGSENIASGDWSTVGGGFRDSASGDFAAIVGGEYNTARGDYSFAGGRRAKALHHGTFVWSDTTDADFISTKDNEFLIRASNGMRIESNNGYYGGYVDNQDGGGDGLRAYADISQGNAWGALYAINYGTSPAVYAYATKAGYFDGNVDVIGNLSKGGGSFKIDHPLDPEGKYLYHSFVESPDMKNVYDGVAVLDNLGEAWVELPEWFEALNRDFRYQLTCIGEFAPVYIAQEISKNQFKISGGRAGMKVSWQVTGIRHDPYANANRIPVVEVKTGDEIGKYLHPEEHGMPESAGIGYEARLQKEQR
jgi:hypothetical protein